MQRRALALDARRFLFELVNVQDHERALCRLQSRYPDLVEISGAIRLARFWALHVEEETYEPGRPDSEFLREYWLIPLRDTLRSIWTVDDVRAKRWGLFRVLQDYFQYNDTRFNRSLLRTSSGYWNAGTLDPPTKFEDYFLGLMEAGQTRKCRNSECPAPYFFAKRSSQQYCSDVCAVPAQRNHKTNWWKKNGKRWRAERRKSLLRQAHLGSTRKKSKPNER
jgi:hypothetical protein